VAISTSLTSPLIAAMFVHTAERGVWIATANFIKNW
jgi:hypothetical protein